MRVVVMNIAGFKVSHSVGTDKDTTALQAARARSSSSGAMEEMPQTVQNANTHILRCQNHEHAHSSRSVQGSVQWGDGTLQVGSIREGALTPSCHDTSQNSERTSGAMERYMHGFDLAQ